MPPKTRTDKSSRGDTQLWSNRKAVLISMSIAVTFLAATYYAYNQFGQRYVSVPHLHSLTDRLVWTLRYQVLGLSVVILTTINVWVSRLLSHAINPLAGYESVVERSNKILTNTLEQFVMNAINQLILSTYLSESNLRFIPLLNVYFLIGRIGFWIGYQIAPKYRIFGFIVTFVPTLLVFSLNAYFLSTTNSNFLFDGGKPFGRTI
ncbi:transmembrane protein 79-like [Oppia nitens]|uniref:transmembrane protein 79-like n=1 Tax=Oppia nitens TaxID=1686743 RepID=UPI0023DA7D0A|nr:transmembrane protein 79-like [Oppia nitens]